MRTRYMPWNQFFEEFKKLPPEEPFTLGLSDESRIRANETHPSASKKEIRPAPALFRIRKDPASVNDLRGHNATGTRAQGYHAGNPRNHPLNASIGAASCATERYQEKKAVKRRRYFRLGDAGIMVLRRICGSLR